MLQILQDLYLRIHLITARILVRVHPRPHSQTSQAISKRYLPFCEISRCNPIPIDSQGSYHCGFRQALSHISYKSIRTHLSDARPLVLTPSPLPLTDLGGKKHPGV